MSKQLTHTGIKTAWFFGKENAFGWNPVKGCENKSCAHHPVNTGECRAAEMCNRMAGPWSKAEADFKTKKHPNAIMSRAISVAVVKNNLKLFKPTWLESQFEKQFPKERSCILVGYMTDIAFIPREWVQRIIDKINANNQERETAGLLLHVFQFLTKDPSIYAKFKWPKNCWLGFTATNQSEFLSRYEEIMDPFKGENYSTNQKYAYLEPLREEIKFPGYLYNATEAEWDKLWVIVGGGPEPLHPDWVRSIRDQCQAAGIPFFFKSWGEMIWFQNKQWMSKRDYQALLRIKEASGIMVGIPPDFNKKKYKENEIDDKVWEQFPEVK